MFFQGAHLGRVQHPGMFVTDEPSILPVIAAKHKDIRARVTVEKTSVAEARVVRISLLQFDNLQTLRAS